MKKTSAAKPEKRKRSSAMKGKRAPKEAAQRNAKKSGFEDVYAALLALLRSYEGRLVLKTASTGYEFLESLVPTYKNRPMFFAGVRAGKSYVSYHLLPLYMDPKMVKMVPPELKKRMQGKACFNFTAVDPERFAELAQLTAAGYQRFKELKYL
jgi:hypothetical protein